LARQIAARFAIRAISSTHLAAPPVTELSAVDKFVDVLLADWADLCVPARPQRGTATYAPLELPINFGTLSLATRRDPRATNPDWVAIQRSLESKGLQLRSQDLGAMSAALSSVVSTFEIVDVNEKVVSGGKGSSEAGALRSALGEAVERIVAQGQPDKGVFLASLNELQAQGIATPRLQAELADLFSPELLIEWIPARTLKGIQGALPAELAFYPHDRAVPVVAFTSPHTAGLASGANTAEAIAAALIEAIETDAYWLSMRTHRICGTFPDLRTSGQPRVATITQHLADIGIRVHAGLINFDWPLSIVHVVLENQSESLPALSHGLGSGLTHTQAIERALLEAVQVYSGLKKVVAEYWPQISLRLRTRMLAEPALIWSSQSFRGRIVEMFESADTIEVHAPCEHGVESLSDLQRWLERNNFVPWVAPLGTFAGLSVVRVFLEGAVSPFTERGRPSARLLAVARELGVRNLYFDPILT